MKILKFTITGLLLLYSIVSFARIAIPTGLTVTAVSSSQINLTWKNQLARGYNVYRDGRPIGFTTTTKYSDKNLKQNVTYKYQLQAVGYGNTLSFLSPAVIGSTLTTDPVPPTEPPPASSEVIGYLGCSMTQGIGYGLKNLGSTLGWQPVPDIGGGGIKQWSENFSNKYWSEFNKSLALQPTKTILWELCALQNSISAETYENAIKVINHVKELIPGVVIYVSAQPSYNPSSHECAIAGIGGQERMAKITAELVANGHALLGPTFGPLAYPSQVLTDGCHPNNSGEKSMAQQFIDFFFKTNPPTPDPTDPPPSNKDCTCTPIGACTCSCTVITPPPVDPPPTPSPSAGIASGIYVVDTEPGVDIALANASADGLLARSQWTQMESTEGKYDFSVLCSKITKASKLGKAVSIVNYTTPPTWLVNKVPTSETWDLQMGRVVKTIVPWNETGLSAMRALASAQANFTCDGYPIKAHPAVKQVDTNIFGALSIRDQPANATLEQMTKGVTESVKIWREAYSVPLDPKSYYMSTVGSRTMTEATALSLIASVQKLYPDQHGMVENWDVAGIGNANILKASKNKIVQACGVFSNSTIKCSATGQSGNTPKAAYDKILKPLGGVKSLQIYPPDFEKYPEDMKYLHEEMNK